jgi:hypothetical protein
MWHLGCRLRSVAEDVWRPHLKLITVQSDMIDENAQVVRRYTRPPKYSHA